MPVSFNAPIYCDHTIGSSVNVPVMVCACHLALQLNGYSPPPARQPLAHASEARDLFERRLPVARRTRQDEVFADGLNQDAVRTERIEGRVPNLLQIPRPGCMYRDLCVRPGGPALPIHSCTG